MTTSTVSIQTVRDRVAQGPIAAPDALRYALILGEALRKLHDAGQSHGAVSPDNISITSTGVELLPAQGATGAVTPYTAPEVVAGQAPDARSDIFSFGAVLYEMLTGQPVFEGENPSALAWAIGNASPAPSGSPAVDKLVGSCLTKDPGARVQRIQKVMMELKLLSVAVRRAEATPGKRDAQLETAIRTELQQVASRLESKFEARLAAYEQSLNEVHRSTGAAIEAQGQSLNEVRRTASTALEAQEQNLSEVRRTANSAIQVQEQSLNEVRRTAGEAIEALRARIESAAAELAAAQNRAVQVEQTVQGVSDRLAARLEEGLSTAARQTGDLEQTIEATRQRTAAFQESVAAEMRALEQTVKAQGAIIESARTAMAQTDDLVERVVEALESLQSTVLEQSEERSMAIN